MSAASERGGNNHAEVNGFGWIWQNVISELLVLRSIVSGTNWPLSAMLDGRVAISERTFPCAAGSARGWRRQPLLPLRQRRHQGWRGGWPFL